MSPLGCQNYREFLRDQLDERCSRNARYSLRAFARDLGLSPARLSELLSGKQGLSLAWAKRISRRLDLSERETERFCDLVESQHARSPARRKSAVLRLAHAQATPALRLQLDAFRTVAEWYPFAILELVSVKGFESTPRWIAKRLGITVSQAESAIERLIRLEQLERDPRGNLRAVHDSTFTVSGVPSDAIKDFHRRILEKASLAIGEQAVAERDFSSSCIAIARDQVPEAQRLLAELRRRFWQALETDRPKEAVYCLSTAFFRLDQKESSS